MQFEMLVEGRLLRRYKRFLADVTLPDGRAITVHCPNTGAMTGCAEPGARVWLSRSSSAGRKYAHSWELVETAEGMACIHSARANQVVREAFADNRIAGFDGYPEIRREVRYGSGSRADLLLEGAAGRVLVEVKSVTLCRERGQGAFPDAVSARGSKHLRELQAALDLHTRCLLLFCVMHEGVRSVCAAGDIDRLYRQALVEAVAAGVEVQAWRTAVSPAGLVLERPLPFSIDPPSLRESA